MSALAQTATAPAAAARTAARRGELYARFMERRGRSVVEAAGRLWHSQEGRFYSPAPYHDVLDPAPDEIDRMLWRQRAMGVRYLAADRCGLPSGLYVVRGVYDIPDLSSSTRRNVRRSLETYTIRRLDRDELLEQGLDLNRETMGRQQRDDPEYSDPARWRTLVGAIAASDGVEAVGAVRDGRVAAYILAYEEHGWRHVLAQFSRTDELGGRPNEGLAFEFTRAALARPEIDAVCYGTIGLSSSGGLHEFKHRMGFQVEPAAWGVRWHPAAAPIFASGPGAKALSALRRRYPANDRLGKLASLAEGGRRSRQGVVAEPYEEGMAA